jgi:hypothetical protein
MTKQRREGEANGPRGQRPPGASRAGPSWTEFVRPAHQAVVAFAGAGIINRAEPRACGHSREPICLDSEPDTERNAGSASNAAGDGCGRARSDKAGFQPYRGKLALWDEQRGWGKRREDLMAVCHAARKGRNIGIHWSKPVAPPLHSTSSPRDNPRKSCLFRATASASILIVRKQNQCRTKPTADLRLRLLSNPKLVLLLTGHGSRHAHIGRARKRSCEGIPVPGLGRK